MPWPFFVTTNVEHGGPYSAALWVQRTRLEKDVITKFVVLVLLGPSVLLWFCWAGRALAGLFRPHWVAHILVLFGRISLVTASSGAGFLGWVPTEPLGFIAATWGEFFLAGM